MHNPLIIAGASVRAAAYSAARAGFSPWCVDQFADADLVAQWPAQSIPRYPQGLVEALQAAPAAPWMYTGAVENHPRVIARIAASRELWGNTFQVLKAVRDAEQVASVLRQHGFRAPEIARAPDALPTDGTWLVKRRRSAGGLSICRWDGVSRQETPVTHYFQRFVEGIACSAVYVAAAGNAVLLGATRQLIGERWAGASGFQYVGSIGPLALSDSQEAELRRLGESLSAAFSLSGLFGVDFVLNDAGVWPIEVNPRYTASVEVLERATGLRAIHHHTMACRDSVLPLATDAATALADRHGKAILFAPRHAHVTAEVAERLLAWSLAQAWPEVADIPAAGSAIEPGAPVATVFASGWTDSEVLAGLRERMTRLRGLLFPECDAGIE